MESDLRSFILLALSEEYNETISKDWLNIETIFYEYVVKHGHFKALKCLFHVLRFLNFKLYNKEKELNLDNPQSHVILLTEKIKDEITSYLVKKMCGELLDYFIFDLEYFISSSKKQEELYKWAGTSAISITRYTTIDHKTFNDIYSIEQKLTNVDLEVHQVFESFTKHRAAKSNKWTSLSKTNFQHIVDDLIATSIVMIRSRSGEKTKQKELNSNINY